jgi:RNA polymerase sigma-70 factor, ECF subfamily
MLDLNTPVSYANPQRAPVPRSAPTSTNRMAHSCVSVKGGEDESLNAVAADPGGYDELYRTHHARVLRLCRLLLSDPHEADDVTQDVFMKLLQAHQSDERAIAWGPWLTRVTVNACRDRRRSGWWRWWHDRHQEFVETDFSSAMSTPEQHALSNEARSHIWRCLRELSARQQEVFVLRQIEGWSTEEVAETLGVSTGSIKRHLYRAVHHLRSALRGHL